MAVELLPHQLKAVEELKNGNVLKGGVGSGKTPTSLAYYWTKVLGGSLNDFDSISDGVDLYVFTTALKRDSGDWQKWGSKFCLTEGDPSQSIAGITFVVESYNNMHKYTGVKNAFIIMDEQRLVGSGLWSKTFLQLARRNRWIMLSATPADKWEDYIPLFIANGFYKNRAEFTREHLVYSYFGSFPKLERYLGTAKLARLRASILVDMPFARHTVRHLHDVDVEYDQALFERVVKDRWNVYEERPLKDVAELFATMRKVVNSDGSRLEALRSLMQTHPRLIVFYNFDYELERLRLLADSTTSPASLTISLPSGSTGSRKRSRTNLPLPPSTETTTSPNRVVTDLSVRTALSESRKNSELKSSHGKESGSRTSKITPSHTSLKARHTEPGLQIAEWNGHKHEQVPESDRWVYLVQYAAGAEAWNCTTTDSIAYYSLTYSYRFFEQTQGRIDRLDTPFVHLRYYILKSKSLMDKMIWGKLLGKESFNEKDAMKDLKLWMS